MAKQTKERDIEQALLEITELVEMQRKAIRTADSLLHLKNCMIEILEDQKRINDKQMFRIKCGAFGLILTYLFAVIVLFYAN